MIGQIFDDFRLNFSHQKALIDAFPTIPMQSTLFVNGRRFVDFGDLVKFCEEVKNIQYKLSIIHDDCSHSCEYSDEKIQIEQKLIR